MNRRTFLADLPLLIWALLCLVGTLIIAAGR